MITTERDPQVSQWAKSALSDMLGRVFAELEPRAPLSIGDWAEKYRWLSKEENPDFSGQFDLDNTPALRGILAACSDPRVRRVIVQKAAQIGYTAGVVCSVLGYHVHWKPCVQVVMFPRKESAKDFDAEKFAPMVRATAVLNKLITLKSRAKGNSITRKYYPGGLAKWVASNSPADVKSTSAKVRIVEEPDDTNKNVKGQGKSIGMLRERGKTIRNSLELIGGTPTAKGASEIEAEIKTTDQSRFLVPCHACDERHEVEFRHVTIPGLEINDEDRSAPDFDTRYPLREVYGRARWEDAFYSCPHCGAIWTDEQRCDNIRRIARIAPHFGWEATADSVDRGFFCNELQSVFEGSYVPKLAEKYLRALHMLEQGDPSDMIVFTNSTRGMSWEYKGELPEEDELRARAEAYSEWTVPAGGLLPLMNVDVQHDRLAVTVWVFGAGCERWCVYWGEHYGQTIVAGQGAWLELEELLRRKVKHASGAELAIAAVGIDAGDGNTSDAVYAFVRKHNRSDRQVIATKGAPDDEGRIEIWTPPKAIDPNNRATKAAKWGVHVHIVGAAKAKDLILGTSQDAGLVRLTGNGAGRMHWYKDIRADFYEQLLSEIKVPSPTNPRKRRWKPRTDRRNEVLDCTTGSEHLCRHLRLHLWRREQWELLERRIRQAPLLDANGEPAAQPAPPPAADETSSKVQTSAQLPPTDSPSEPQPPVRVSVAPPRPAAVSASGKKNFVNNWS